MDLNIFSSYIQKFEDRVLPVEWVPRGILMSEGFAVCAIASHLKIDYLIESGICNGKSTSIWIKYFVPEVTVFTMDINPKKDVIEKLDKLSLPRQTNPDGVREYIYTPGDANFVLPYILSNLPSNKRIGLFIDGPKSNEAVDLAMKCFDKHSNVVFSAFHDSNKASTTRKYLDDWNVDKFYTDDPNYVEKYGYLDVDESKIDVEQGLQWTPYKILPNRDLGGSYGMTICVAFNKGVTL